MPRRKQPEFDRFDKPPIDTAARGLRVHSPAEIADVIRIARARQLGRQVDAARRLGVSAAMLSGLERGSGGSQLNLTLGILSDLGLDVVLVPRDPARSLQQISR
jgi:hypothetical protein